MQQVEGYPRLEAALKKYGEDVKMLYTNDLKALQYRIADKITVKVNAFGNKYDVVLNLPEYWKYIEDGRKPGAKMPPEKPIIEWIKFKGITPRDKKITEKQLSFLIRRKIGRDGIKATHFLADAIEKNDNLIKNIVESFKIDIIEGLSSTLKI